MTRKGIKLSQLISIFTSGLSSLGVPWQIIQPYFNLGGQIIPTYLLLAHPDFQTFRRPCTSKNVLKILIKIQLTKSNPKIIRG